MTSQFVVHLTESESTKRDAKHLTIDSRAEIWRLDKITILKKHFTVYKTWKWHTATYFLLSALVLTLTSLLNWEMNDRRFFSFTNFKEFHESSWDSRSLHHTRYISKFNVTYNYFITFFNTMTIICCIPYWWISPFCGNQLQGTNRGCGSIIDWRLHLGSWICQGNRTVLSHFACLLLLSETEWLTYYSRLLLDNRLNTDKKWAL